MIRFLSLSQPKRIFINTKEKIEKAVKENPGEKAYLDKYFKAINEYMTRSETELSKPAICM
ncbi:MAG: hypothetical protein IPK57_10785 [Chitinophagaceae bacterium]|nr:hypothetical protein [Chitinophagaceae bacterium]